VTSSPAATAIRYGRVVEASLDRFLAECFDSENVPPLGTPLVLEDGAAIFAVVADIFSESRDAGRPIALHGAPGDDLARVRADNPNIPALLRTAFAGAIVGHRDGGALRQYLPSAPPPVQARVRRATAAECAQLAESFDFIRLLLDGAPHADDCCAALLRLLATSQPDGYRFLVGAGKALTVLLCDDPLRLHAMLRRLQP
jgi:hypothetical protein